MVAYDGTMFRRSGRRDIAERAVVGTPLTSGLTLRIVSGCCTTRSIRGDLFDLANNGPPYGSAEETFGKVMKSSFMPYRSELFIATAGHDVSDRTASGSRKYHEQPDASEADELDYVDVFTAGSTPIRRWRSLRRWWIS